MRTFVSGVLGFLAVACLSRAVWGVAYQAEPDFLVSEVTYRDYQLAIEIQNQGPARHNGPVEIEVKLEQDRKIRARLETRVGGPEWGVFESRRSAPVDIKPLLNFDPSVGYVNFTVHVKVDPKSRIRDSRPQNNDFIKSFSMAGEDANETPRERGDYQTSKTLPDLVIEEIFFDPPYLKARYSNRGGEASGADFRFRWKANGRERGSGLSERYKVPPAGKVYQTGGLTMGLLGLISGQPATVTATIDYEDRVREADESNNSLEKRLPLGPSTQADPAPKAGAHGQIEIGEQLTMPVVSSFWVIDPETQEGKLLLFPFVPKPSDIADIRLGSALSVVNRSGLPREQRAYLSLALKARDRPKGRIRVGVKGPVQSHSVDMEMESAFQLQPGARGRTSGTVTWSVRGAWPAGKEMIRFDCGGEATVYQAARP